MKNAQFFPHGRMRSTGRLNHESQRGRSLRHALVISNQDFQIGGNPLRRRKVYRVQRSEHSRVERRRAIQQRIVQTDEMNPVKDQSRSAQGCGSEVTNGAGTSVLASEHEIRSRWLLTKLPSARDSGSRTTNFTIADESR